MASKTTEKLAVFVREYLVDRNGTRAAIAAGYAPNSASVTSCRLLRNAKVQAAISELTEQRLERLEITGNAVLQELARIGFANMNDYLSVREDGRITVDLSRMTAVQGAGLADLRIDEYASGKTRIKRTRIKLAPKTRALELLGKHLSLWNNRFGAKHDLAEGLAERLHEARLRFLRSMSDAELNEMIEQIEAELPHDLIVKAKTASDSV